MVRHLIGFTQIYGNECIEYLGVPLFQGRTTSKHFQKMKEKAKARIDGWSSKILSQGGEMILVNSVLNSTLVYTLAAYAVSKKVIRELEGSFSTFIWGQYQGKPKEDGRLGKR